MSPIQTQDAFSRCHPLANFLYFALVLVFTMLFMHPLCLLTSLGCALAYALYLSGWRAVRRMARYLLPIALMAAAVNLLFNHRGATVLARLPWGSPLTLESALYALATAAMLWAVLLWFSCYNAVMTSDKFLYLFGRIVPSLSLALTMTLRFVPRFTRQLHAVSDAQRCLGRDVSRGPLLQRLKTAVTILSILVTWSLENAIETADSMKSRGYGLPGRTAFSIYPFTRRDRAMLAWLGLWGGYILYAGAAGSLSWDYYPALRAAPLTPLTVSFHLAYLALCLTPLLLDRKEDRLWARLNCES